MPKTCDICSKKCFGIDGYDGSCCTIENRDFIIGSHDDTEEFIQRLSSKLGRRVEWGEVFIEYEEGKDLLPDRPSWQRESSYPALRVDTRDTRLPCIFYNTMSKQCMVYDIRPNTCRTFECGYLIHNKTD